jgi:hypothetical protein
MTMTRRLPIALSLSLLASVAPAAAQQAASQSPVDSRWLSYLGCWRQLEETVREDDAGPDEKADRVMTATAGVVICVTPTANPDAVTLSTIVEQQSTFEETIVADGSTQPVVGEPGCEGTQRAEWSPNGVRLLAKAELKCGDGTLRSVSGMTLIAPGAMWIDIQVVSTNGREGVRVRRYRRSSDQTRVADRLSEIQLALAASAAAARATKFTLEEVKQSVGKLPPSVIEAALVETGAGFPLNAKRLQELDQAGVPPRVIDLMIALSFPNKYIVERDTATTSARGSRYGGAGGGGGLPWIVDEDLYDLWPYRYSPFGYGLWGYDYLYDYYNGPIYVVPPGGGGVPPVASEHGRVINGAGYTQVRSRPAEPGSGIGGIFSGGDGSSSGGGSSGGGGVSTQGYSSGGGGGDGGRSAMPRPPK